METQKHKKWYVITKGELKGQLLVDRDKDGLYPYSLLANPQFIFTHPEGKQIGWKHTSELKSTNYIQEIELPWFNVGESIIDHGGNEYLIKKINTYDSATGYWSVEIFEVAFNKLTLDFTISQTGSAYILKPEIPEFSVLIKGKEYSEDTVHLALKAYIE